MTKLSKPVVIFLDNADVNLRMQLIKQIRPNINGMNIFLVIRQPHLVITNLSRHGNRLDYFLVRCSNCKTHFINKDCYKNAIVFGQSDWIGTATSSCSSLASTDILDLTSNKHSEYIGELE